MTFVSIKNIFVTAFVSPVKILIFSVRRDFCQRFGKRNFPRPAECLLENQSVLCFGALSIFGSSLLQCFDECFVYFPNKKLFFHLTATSDSVLLTIADISI